MLLRLKEKYKLNNLIQGILMDLNLRYGRIVNKPPKSPKRFFFQIYLGELDCESVDKASEEQLASEFPEFEESRFS